MDHAGDLPGLNLQPGELYLARSPMILQTILGSCVGVTFWSARLGAGALCHGVLPRWRDSYRAGSAARTSIATWISAFVTWPEQFDALGADRQELEVKVFGGADVLPVMATRATNPPSAH